MPFCRCGELCQQDKCTKCGLDLKSRRNSMDPWQSRYLGSMIGLNSLSSPTGESPESRSPCSPLMQRTISPITKRMSRPFSTLLDSRRVAPSKTSSSLSMDEHQFPVVNVCSGCNEKLTGKTVRLPDSQYKYHWACLKCKGCSKPFEDTSFFIDSTKNVYHRTCAPDPPQQCSRCSQMITNKYLSVNSQTLHPSCFRCKKCHKMLQPNSIYTDKNGSYCQACSNEEFAAEKDQIAEHVKIVPHLQTYSPKNITNLTIPPYSTSRNTSPCIQKSTFSLSGNDTNKPAVVKPSALMSSRGRPLPKFGVVKECAGCKQRIFSVHEEAPGPKASRWHKKCLVCHGCSKKLDSGATVYEDETTAKLSPWCTTCLLSKRKKSIHSSAAKPDLAVS